jgi:hypothetical protein
MVTSPLALAMSGTAEVCDDVGVTGVSFTWLATSCIGQDTFELTINGTTVATPTPDPNGLSCTCVPTVGSYTVPIGTALPLLTPGLNQFGVRKSADLSFSYTGLAWAYATVTTADGPQRVEIFDVGGGNSYDNPDLCGSDYTFGAVDSVEDADLCDEVASESWSGTLPCSLDVSGLGSQNYTLMITATDGVVGSPSRDIATFAHDGEGTLFINSSCGLACNEMSDQCISVCPPVAHNNCKTAGKSILVRKKSSDGSKDKLLWKWTKGQTMTLADLGNPVTTADYVFCLYGGPAQTLLAGGEIVVPKSGSKWAPLASKGWSYGDSAGAAAGVQKLSVKTSSANASKAQLKGKGAMLPDPVQPTAMANFPLVVQLLNSQTATCLESSFAAGDVKKNHEGELKLKK